MHHNCNSAPSGAGADTRLTLWLQVALAAVFFSDALVYTIIGLYVPQAFPYASASLLSLTLGAYATAQVAAILLLLLLQTLPVASDLGPKQDYLIVAGGFFAFSLSACLTTVLPYSMYAMLLQRILLGVTAAVYSVYALKGVVRGFDAQDAVRGIACINAGLVAGDSIAPIIGNILYQVAGVRAANGIQPAFCAVTLLLLAIPPTELAMQEWSKHRAQQQLQMVMPSRGNCQDPEMGCQMSSKNKDTLQEFDMCMCMSCDTTSHQPDQETPTNNNKDITTAAMEQHVAFSLEVVEQGLDANNCQKYPPSGRDQLKLLFRCLLNLKLTSQYMVLVLTQMSQTVMTIVISQALNGQPIWISCSAFGFQALTSIASPFLTEAALRRWPNMCTPAVMAGMSVLVAASNGLILPISNMDHMLAVTMLLLCALTGAAYSTLEVLVFVHTSQTTAAMGCDLALDYGAIFYTLFYCIGSILGGVVGGAVAHASRPTWTSVAAVLAGVTGCYGIGLGFMMFITKKKSCKS